MLENLACGQFILLKFRHFKKCVHVCNIGQFLDRNLYMKTWVRAYWEGPLTGGLSSICNILTTYQLTSNNVTVSP